MPMVTDPAPAAPPLCRWLTAPTPAARLVVFRTALGVILALAAVRYVVKGWPTTLLAEPPFRFHYFGFAFVEPLSGPGMTALVLASAALAMLWALGRGGAMTLGAYLAIFAYVELIDKTLYLNHYYLVSILVAMLCFSGVRSTAWAQRHTVSVPRWEYAAFQVQICLVYFYAGVWKLNADWLGRAEPLASWLWKYRTLPVVGHVVALDITPFFMSYAGAAFDLTIWAFLLWRVTSRWAFAVCIVFHLSVWLLFPIGVFSVVMVLCAWLLMPPLGSGPVRAPHLHRRAARRGVAVLFGAHLCLQVLLPWRFLLSGVDVNWHEQGYRFSWRVMLNEKLADVQFSLRLPDGRRVFIPHDDLSALQARQMGYQPDMLLEYAHALCERHRVAIGGTPDVRVDARVAHNGRRAQPFIRDVNLCTQTRPIDIVQPRTGSP